MLALSREPNGTGRGLLTHYVLFVMTLADRTVEALGVAAKPDEA